MVTTATALLYISYPVQVIGRNIRFLFVVIVGAFFSRIRKMESHLRIGKHKVFIASIITVGVILFNFAKEVPLSLSSQRRTKQISTTPNSSGWVMSCWGFRWWSTPSSQTPRPTARPLSSPRPTSCSRPPTPSVSCSASATKPWWTVPWPFL